MFLESYAVLFMVTIELYLGVDSRLLPKSRDRASYLNV